MIQFSSTALRAWLGGVLTIGWGLLEADEHRELNLFLAHPSPLLRAWIHFADVAIQLGDRHLAVWKRTKTAPRVATYHPLSR